MKPSRWFAFRLPLDDELRERDVVVRVPADLGRTFFPGLNR